MDEQIVNKRKLPDMPVSPQLQDEFIAFVHERVGILIKRDHRELLKTISESCNEYHCTPEEYLNLLKKADDHSEIIRNLVSSITIGETYFFRDKQQIRLLNEIVLPKIIAKKVAANEKTLRIWSAGCSSGEEIYTIVMLLKDLLPDMDRWQCYFLASDINIDVLKKGISGKYGEWSMRSIPDMYLKRYFTKFGTSYQLDDDVKNRVRFEYVNLNSEAYPSIMNGTMGQDLVLCRNVLIYFDNEHIKSILTQISKCIVDDGYILLGASDPIAMMNTDIASVQGYPSLFMKKASVPVAAPIDRLVPPAREIEGHHDQVTPEYQNEQAKPTTQTQRKKESFLNRNDVDEITELLHQEKWPELINKLDVLSMTVRLNSSQLLAKATALANTGKTAEAVKACEEALELDKMNKDAYFLYAITLSDMKKNKEAEAAYRKALYIDPDFLLCRYQFGLFLIHIDRYKEGIKALQNTIKSASQFDETGIVPDSQNMQYKDLIAVLKNEIALHQ